MAGVGDMLNEARNSLGLGEPNKIHRWYATRNGSAFAAGSTPWCDMAITYWAFHSGNHRAVCPQGDRAYTVWHAQDFQRLGRWHSGTDASVRAAKPGDIVFIDWNGSNSVGAIDHVGVVEKNLGGGRVQTIEGNTDNRCLRRVRAADVIVGYGRPAYSGASSDVVSAPSGSPLLRRGAGGDRVFQLQRALLKAGEKLPTFGADGDFGAETEAAVKSFQRKAGITADGIYGPQTAAKLAAAL
ncbi:hypothetical protein DPM19_20645 [Actinomadura craniellae]|uniref:CHAP domain-containing protein n=1 Tax=Actinomadura craniellae TaxID=2231787 RepID=A0A365H367_9ACTN|nr:peptidoglycan-binding protein [Actinomadura craniellae]RAY13468.1 hypothetical protein DPM19_20645 [Actinomadura craniellae]